MASPWFDVPLEDYERHMAVLGQLPFLARVFGETVRRCGARSALVAGCAGGNGFDAVESHVRLIGVDLLPAYLEDAARRYPRAEFIAADLTRDTIPCEPVELVHAALVFEHCGLEGALENCKRLVAPGGWFSVVLQLPVEAAAVAATGVESIQTLKQCFRFIDRQLLAEELDGFVLEFEAESDVREKRFWQRVWRRG
jgi:SAM-dependent methyltransferase